MDLALILAALEAVAIDDPADREGFELLGHTLQDEINGTLAPSLLSAGTPFQFRDLTWPLRVYRVLRPRPWLLPIGLGLLALGVVSVSYWFGRRHA